VERYYTRTAEKAARELERRQRAQDRRNAEEAPTGLDPYGVSLERAKRDVGRRTRKVPRDPRRVG
jgi:hypothetical protein